MGKKKNKRSRGKRSAARTAAPASGARASAPQDRAPAKKNGAAAKKGRQAPAAKDGSGGGASWWDVSVQFLREVKTELKKVTWPTRRQTISSTGVVVVLVIIVSVFLGLVDMILARLVRLVIG